MVTRRRPGWFLWEAATGAPGRMQSRLRLVRLVDRTPAALAPKPVCVTAVRRPGNGPVGQEDLAKRYSWAAYIYERAGAAERLNMRAGPLDTDLLAAWLRERHR